MNNAGQSILRTLAPATTDDTAGERISLAEVARRVLPAWQGELDRSVAARVRDPLRISCRAGCVACCRQPVPISVPEAFMLGELVASLPEEERCRVLAARDLTEARLHAGGLAFAPLLSLGRDYMALGLPCPFLVDENCSIHSRRPSACREHLVVSPPRLCEALDGGAQPVSFPLSLTDVLARLAARLLVGAPIRLPLIRVLEWTAENVEDGLRTWAPGEIHGIVADILVDLRPR